MRRILPFVFALLLGCAIHPTPPATEPPETAAPTQAPTEAPIEADVIAVRETDTPAPLPTLSPSPVLTPAPTPAPTQNPYRGEAATVSETNPGFWYCAPTEALKARIIGTSFPENEKDCPVRMEDLRYVHLLYVDFDGEAHEGELLVHQTVVSDVMEIFEALYDARWPLRSVRLVDDYGQPFSDELSMSADNSSAFCCRRVTGETVFSRHSYGTAIDINPVENPYLRKDGSFAPIESAPYLDRSDVRPGMITGDDLCFRLFSEHGWKWGGNFTSEVDYQHFSKDVKGVTP